MSSKRERKVHKVRRCTPAWRTSCLDKLQLDADGEIHDAVIKAMRASGKWGRRMHGKKTPGAALMILVDSKVVFQKCYGYAHVAKEIPVTPQTRFDLASCSKHITAYAVYMLVEQGVLSETDTLGGLLPKLNFGNMQAQDKASVTVAQLLNHTSGLTDPYGETGYSYFRDGVGYSSWKVLQDAVKLKMEFAPGKKHSYSNTNYIALACIIERHGRKYRNGLQGESKSRRKSSRKIRFGKWMRRNIFHPLGMYQTEVFDHKELVERAYPYTFINKKLMDEDVCNDTEYYDESDRSVLGHHCDEVPGFHVHACPMPVGGDGNVFTSLRDLIVWDKALTDETLLQRKGGSKKKMGSAAPNASGYAWGWCIGNPGGDGYLYRNHSGSWFGTSTFVSRQEFKGYTVSTFVLMNIDEADAEAVGDVLEKQFEKSFNASKYLKRGSDERKESSEDNSSSGDESSEYGDYGEGEGYYGDDDESCEGEGESYSDST